MYLMQSLSYIPTYSIYNLHVSDQSPFYSQYLASISIFWVQKRESAHDIWMGKWHANSSSIYIYYIYTVYICWGLEDCGMRLFRPSFTTELLLQDIQYRETATCQWNHENQNTMVWWLLQRCLYFFLSIWLFFYSVKGIVLREKRTLKAVQLDTAKQNYKYL